jgi:hypothetical protein
VAPSSISTIDAFVVKYDATKQRSLPLHCDQSEFSLTVALNSHDEDYQGGGKDGTGCCCGGGCSQAYVLTF